MENYDLKEIKEILKNMTSVLTNVSEDVRELKDNDEIFKQTFDFHTTSLDEIIKNTKNWQTEIAAVKSAINPAPSCRGIAPRRKAILSHSSPQQAAGYSGRCWINRHVGLDLQKS